MQATDGEYPLLTPANGASSVVSPFVAVEAEWEFSASDHLAPDGRRSESWLVEEAGSGGSAYGTGGTSPLPDAGVPEEACREKNGEEGEGGTEPKASPLPDFVRLCLPTRLIRRTEPMNPREPSFSLSFEGV